MALRRIPKELDFTPSERPPWHVGTSLPETTEMLSQITEWQNSAAGWTADQLEFVRIFNTREAVNFVILSNQMEREGTQDLVSTEELVFAAMGAESANALHQAHSTTELATIQTYKALAWSYSKRDEMLAESQGTTQESLFLTTSLVVEAHKILMADLIPNAGQFRHSEAYSSGSDNFYVSPHLVEAHIESLLDKYNSIVQHTELSGAAVFKLSAWFLYHFLTIHPFSDGNGRLARILANSILFLHAPFPVPLKPRATITTAFTGVVDQWREHYLNAIVKCRRDTNVLGSAHRPRDLAALVIQSVWNGWKSLMDALEFRRTSSLGPLVLIDSSQIKKEDLALKIRKWNKHCDAQAAAAALIRQLKSGHNEEFSLVLSDGKELLIVDRTLVDNTPPLTPSSPYRDTMLKIRLS